MRELSQDERNIIADIERDLRDPLAVYDYWAMQHALHLREVFTRKQWEIEVNYDLKPEAALREMIDRSSSSRIPLPGNWGRLKWWAFGTGADTWGRNFSAEGRWLDTTGRKKETVETLRFRPGVRGDRVRLVMEENRLDFGGFEQIVGFLAKFVRHISRDRKVMITRPEYLIGSEYKPERQLIFHWYRADVPKLQLGSYRGFDFHKKLNVRWDEADLLVVRRT